MEERIGTYEKSQRIPDSVLGVCLCACLTGLSEGSLTARRPCRPRGSNGEADEIVEKENPEILENLIERNMIL